MIQSGTLVPFLLGIPSVKACVIGVSPNNQYILHHCYETQDKKGQYIIVNNTYYRDKDFIDAYWADVT